MKPATLTPIIRPMLRELDELEPVEVDVPGGGM
jgi:hypothetical protein